MSEDVARVLGANLANNVQRSCVAPGECGAESQNDSSSAQVELTEAGFRGTAVFVVLSARRVREL